MFPSLPVYVPDHSDVYGFRIAALEADLFILTKTSAGQSTETIRLSDALKQALAANKGQAFMSAAYFMEQSSEWIMKHSGELYLNCSCTYIFPSHWSLLLIPLVNLPPHRHKMQGNIRGAF